MFTCFQLMFWLSPASTVFMARSRPVCRAALAQLVEHVIRNDEVAGSNPACGTNWLKSAMGAKTPWNKKAQKLYSSS